MSGFLLDDVKKLVVEYLDRHGHALTSDIVFDLDVDPDLVVKALESLEEEGKVEGRDPQRVVD